MKNARPVAERVTLWLLDVRNQTYTYAHLSARYLRVDVNTGALHQHIMT